MNQKSHTVDFCVIGGGLAGMCAAIAAARHGVKVVLIHDRPVLGGNASSEIRMWVSGATGRDNRETGLIEEFQLENRYRNALSNYSIWDSVLYEKVRFEPNITLLLNCSCNSAEMESGRIKAVKGWQTTTQKWHYVEAKLFADCSGDSVLAELTGAEWRMGREGRDEFDEDIAPEKADDKTMGLSCLIQGRETNGLVGFIRPKWAYEYMSCDKFPYREHGINSIQNFWWLEIGGDKDTISDTEEIRDELLKIAFGVWDHIKNYCEKKEQFRNWALEWVGFLPGKRESRRYIGDYILTQHDVLSKGRFDDVVAYGGWPMDDHYPAGFLHPGEPTTFHTAPSPFGIPYRCLYSRNIENLFFAGRNISYTHVAMSSARVMATCALMGQAVGTAAAIASREDMRPRQVYQKRIRQLQHQLMDNDCYLPGRRRAVPDLSVGAQLRASCGDAEALRNGVDRGLSGEDNGWIGDLGDWVEYRFEKTERVREARIVFDSDLNRLIRQEKLGRDVLRDENDPAGISDTEMRCCNPLRYEVKKVPRSMVKVFRIEVQKESGDWVEVFAEDNNYQRLVRVCLDVAAVAVRLIFEGTWGSKKCHVFAFDVR